MVDITQIKDHIREEIHSCQQRMKEFKQELEASKQRLIELQRQIERWVAELEIEDIVIQHGETTHTLEKFDETFEVSLQTLVVSFGSCKLHVEPEEQYLNGDRILLFASSDEDDIKEVIASEGEYHFNELQFGQKRDLSSYTPLTEINFYKLLYGWLKA